MCLFDPLEQRFGFSFPLSPKAAVFIPYRHQAPAQPRCCSLHQRCCSQQPTQPHHVLPHAPHFSLACSAERRHVTCRSPAGACDCRQAAAAAPSAAVGHHPVTAAAHVARQGPGSYFFWRSFVLPCSFVWAGAKSCAPQRSRHTKSQKKFTDALNLGSLVGRRLAVPSWSTHLHLQRVVLAQWLPCSFFPVSFWQFLQQQHDKLTCWRRLFLAAIIAVSAIGFASKLASAVRYSQGNACGGQAAAVRAANDAAIGNRCLRIASIPKL